MIKSKTTKLTTETLVEREADILDSVVETVPNTPSEFRSAVDAAQMHGKDYIEVTQRLFDHLLHGQKSPMLMYGTPTIKVFVEGTREKVEADMMLTPEQLAQKIAKEKSL